MPFPGRKLLDSLFSAVDTLGLDRFRLRFRDPVLEQAYVAEIERHWLPTIRLQTVLGIGAWLAFIPLDIVLLGPEAKLAVAIRACVCVALFLVRQLTYLPNAQRFGHSIMAIGVAACGLGINGLVAFLDAPANNVYYAGLLMVIIYWANLQDFHYFVFASISMSLAALYAVIAIWINPIPTEYIISNLFFIVGTLNWTTWGSYRQEVYIRGKFANEYFLITEKGKTEQLLIAAQAGNRAKTDFLAVMSHELRTPLNAIIGFSEVMQKQLFGPVGNDKYLSYIDDISESGNHLLRIINDILDLSKAEAGKLEIREDEVDVGDLIQASVRMIREKAVQAGLSINIDVADPPPLLWADSRLLRQTMINLVSNSVKFTPSGGTITVRAHLMPEGACRIEVIDTGIGLSKADIPRVVQPFVQVESALARKNGGTGLGLPLVKRITELHHGEFILTSELGVGTTATLVFPKGRVIEPDTSKRKPPIAAAS